MKNKKSSSEIHHFLKSNPGSMEDEGVVIDFIKYDVEPFFEYTLYIMGIVIIMFGALNSIYIGFKEKEKGRNANEVLAYIRVRLSETITLGLTFILGAEVVKTFRVPNIYQLIKVALLVLLRQMITHFLDNDISYLRSEYPDIFDSSTF